MKWEYKVFRDTFFGAQIDGLQEWDNVLEKWINSIAKNGWELVKINEGPGYQVWSLWRRSSV